MVARFMTAFSLISTILAGRLSRAQGLSWNGATIKHYDSTLEDDALAELGVSKLRRRHLQKRGVQLAFIKDEAFQNARPDIGRCQV